MSLTPPMPEEIRAFRQATGLSQAEMAQLLGASKRAVEEWEAGRRVALPMLRLAMAAINDQIAPWSVPGHLPRGRAWFPISDAPTKATTAFGKVNYGPPVWLTNGLEEAKGRWRLPFSAYDIQTDVSTEVEGRWDDENDRPLKFAPTHWSPE